MSYASAEPIWPSATVADAAALGDVDRRLPVLGADDDQRGVVDTLDLSSWTILPRTGPRNRSARRAPGRGAEQSR